MNRSPILLVEDDADDLLFLERAFRLAAIPNSLHVVRGGQDAIDYLTGTGDFADRSKHPLPGLVLLDLKLPQKPGLEVLRWIRSQPQFAKTFVVVLTSSNQNRDMQEAFRLGTNSYLVKPADPDRLTKIIQLVMTRFTEFSQSV
jgi:CheY-like chemotaxis protein